MKNAVAMFMLVSLFGIFFLTWSCGDDEGFPVSDGGPLSDGGASGDADTDTDTDTDADTDADGGAEEDAGTDGGKGDPTGNPCEQQQQAIDDAISVYCTGKDDECCYCKCYNQGKQYTYADQNCECNDAEVEGDGGTEETCEGEARTEAEECLKDVETCVESPVSVANAGCGMSSL